jgi:hypothetical protein
LHDERPIAVRDDLGVRRALRTQTPELSNPSSDQRRSLLVVGERDLQRSQRFKKCVFSHQSGPWACEGNARRGLATIPQ